MNIEILFYTQVGSILAFTVALFVLYRLLINQKDATIELLKEKANFLEGKLSLAEKRKPDVLAKSLSERVDTLIQEIQRLSSDKEKKQSLISQKEKELDSIKEEADELSRQISNAHELMSEYFCPHCKSPMAERTFHSDMVEYQGRDYDIDHEYVAFECGLILHDGEESSPCKNT
ncbi:coiled-coil domain-containing protein [Aeromonas veronii]